ncbi:MAG: hypothetical protein M3N53_02825 [Actinomycetota bacterium]|nr:hypothetical protein [Actinomycetota bacterium]
MPIQTTVVGSYPKPPTEGETFKVRKTIQALDKGSASLDDLHAAQDELARAVIAEQERAGVDVLTDGHVRWDDLLTPFARTMRGFEIGGLLRWFDNNVYYRRPICTGDIEWGGPSSVTGFEFARDATSRAVKAVIPGPVTFARLSVDEHYGDHRAFVLAIARVLAQEAFELEAAGARHIQIDEPALLNAPEDLTLAREALGIVTAELGEAELTLGTYFGDAKRLGADVFDLPVHRVALDLVAGPENRELIRSLPGEKKLQAGIVDGRNTKLEEADALQQTIEDLADQVGPDRLQVAPSSGLEFLPREKARAKLERLCEAARKVGA